MRQLTRRGFLSLGASAAMVAALAGCSQGVPASRTADAPSSPAPAQDASSASVPAVAVASGLRLTAGGQSGVYYGFGRLFARHAAENAGVIVTTLVSDGSAANIGFLEEGSAEFGFCQSDVMTYAYEGSGAFEGMPSGSFSVLAALYDEPVQIVACDPDVKTVADLAGKRVCLGAPDSGVCFNATDILAAYGVRDSAITPTYQGFGDAVGSLMEGLIDAAFIVAGTPTPALTELFSSRTAHLIGLDDALIARLTEAFPTYAATTIGAATYPGQEQAVETVAVGAVLVAADTVSDDAAYALVRDVFESAEAAGAESVHLKYAELGVERGASVTAVPYHPGAARFYAQRGITVESK